MWFLLGASRKSLSLPFIRFTGKILGWRKKRGIFSQYGVIDGTNLSPAQAELVLTSSSFPFPAVSQKVDVETSMDVLSHV